MPDELELTKGNFCYYIAPDAFVEGHGWRVSIVVRDQPGYYPTGDDKPAGTAPWYWGKGTYEEASEICDQMNEAKLGLTSTQVTGIICSSMRASNKRAGQPGRYRVRVMRDVLEYADVVVTATDPDDASAKALDIATGIVGDGGCEWHVDDTSAGIDDSPFVDCIDRLGEGVPDDS